MANTVSIGNLADAIDKELVSYSTAVTEGIKKATETTAKEMHEAIKRDAPVLSGRYKKSMKLRTATETQFSKVKQWYVEVPEYRKSHLLEKPHRTRNGGKTRAFPHIEKNAEAAQEKLMDKVQEVIQNG